MIPKKNIVVSIGNFGAIITVNDKSSIKSKHVFKKDDFNEEVREKVKKIFLAYKRFDTLVLIDTVDQSYKRKVFPGVSKSDLSKLAKRHLDSIGVKNNFKKYRSLNKNILRTEDDKDKSWDCIFISSPISDFASEWIEFLHELPNHFSGIYMLPVESFHLVKALTKTNNKEKKDKDQTSNNNKLNCLILQNKLGGIRQIIHANDGILFTRVVNYNFEKESFIEKYEQDIYATFEYLKRQYQFLNISDLNIINIFPPEVNEKIKAMDNDELKITYYTPYEAAQIAGYGKDIKETSSFCDILLSRCLSQSKKLIRFSTPRFSYLEHFLISISISYYVNLALILGVFIAGFGLIAGRMYYGSIIEDAEIEKFKNFQKAKAIKVKNLQSVTEDAETANLSFERVSDFGKIDEHFSPITSDFYNIYYKLAFLKDYNITLKNFNYNLDIKPESPNANSKYSYSTTGTMMNPTGELETAFIDFDDLIAKLKGEFNKETLKYEELPKDVEIGKKYYSFPVNFTIEKK